MLSSYGRVISKTSGRVSNFVCGIVWPRYSSLAHKGSFAVVFAAAIDLPQALSRRLALNDRFGPRRRFEWPTRLR